MKILLMIIMYLYYSLIIIYFLKVIKILTQQQKDNHKLLDKEDQIHILVISKLMNSKVMSVMYIEDQKLFKICHLIGNSKMVFILNMLLVLQ